MLAGGMMIRVIRIRSQSAGVGGLGFGRTGVTDLLDYSLATGLTDLLDYFLATGVTDLLT